MPHNDGDRAERVSQLQALVENEQRELPQLDRPTLDTLLAQLEQDDRRSARLRIAGWLLAAAIAVALCFLIYHKLN